MSSRKRLAAVAVILAAAGGGVAFYLLRPAAPPVATADSGPVSRSTPSLPKPSGPTPLPDSFESPGLASHRDGPMRLYVAAASEVPLRKDSALTEPGATLTEVPILVVLENDSYDRIDAAHDLSFTGDELFTVGVARVGSNGQREDVFNYSEPSADIEGWGPAERKSFKVLWPTGNASPGDYFISVTPAYGKRQKVEIRTSLK